MAKKRQKVGAKGGENACFGAKDETDAKAMKPATKGRMWARGCCGRDFGRTEAGGFMGFTGFTSVFFCAPTIYIL